MNFPKIEQPLFKMEVPSTKAKINVRPMLVKEEKILLMAKESDETADKLRAIKQIVNNCVSDYDVEKMSMFDIEYLFLKIRAISIDNIVRLTYIDEDDKEPREFEINLDDVKVDFKKKTSNIINIGEKTGLTLRWPSSALYDNIDNIQSESDMMDAFVIDCLVNYFDGDNVFTFRDKDPAEVLSFVEENISAKTYAKIQEFLNNVPSLIYEIKYTNKNGKEKVITLNSLNDFFTF